MKKRKSIMAAFLAGAALACGICHAGQVNRPPENFLYTGSGDLAGIQKLLERPDIAGVQVVYNWKDLESGKGKYSFDQIEQDLRFLEKLGKKLFVQVQDRFFIPEARNIPAYLLEAPEYGGGLVPQIDNPGEGQPVGSGWAVQQWNTELRVRFQKLLRALGKQFDGRVYGVNLPETSIDVDSKRDKTGFSCDKYFNAELENLKVLKEAFKKSYVVQYVNFWPCEWENDHNYMGRLFEFAAGNGVGLGGPDIVPFKKAQMKNSYPFFNKYKGKLILVAMAVQEPTLTYTDPNTKKPFTKEAFLDFGRDYLGAGIIFWSTSAPWLNTERKPENAEQRELGGTAMAKDAGADNKTIVRQYIEKIINTGNVDDVAKYISPGYVEVFQNKKYPLGLDGVIKHVKGVRETYPDLQLVVDQQIAEGEWVATCYTMKGTHLGEWMGIKPTGKIIEVTGVNIDRVVDGKIVEHGGAANLFNSLLDIGAIKIAGK